MLLIVYPCETGFLGFERERIQIQCYCDYLESVDLMCELPLDSVLVHHKEIVYHREGTAGAHIFWCVCPSV